jgi:hypothetical protein
MAVDEHGGGKLEAAEVNAVGGDAEGARGEEATMKAHLADLEKRVPAGFTVVVEGTFVVIGDEAPARVRARSTGTVSWATEHLKQDFFERDPAKILDVWLFKDERSYRKHAERLFGDDPDTPYGYYSESHGALIMNISTGGGTLVHEMVHPFIDANFEACPAWFNEGLASLFEQSSMRDGHIIGLTNWRLEGLQEGIAARELPTFKELTGTTTQQFYGSHYGYPQARYLLYYLQERGLLLKYYRAFVAAAAEDPTGYQTLQTVLGRRDMDVFQAEWERYVMGLSFP